MKDGNPDMKKSLLPRKFSNLINKMRLRKEQSKIARDIIRKTHNLCNHNDLVSKSVEIEIDPKTRKICLHWNNVNFIQIIFDDPQIKTLGPYFDIGGTVDDNEIWDRLCLMSQVLVHKNGPGKGKVIWG